MKKYIFLPFIMTAAIIAILVYHKPISENRILFDANVEALSFSEGIPEASEPLDDGIVRCDGDAIYKYRKIEPYDIIYYQHYIWNFDEELIQHYSECVAEGANQGGRLVGNENKRDCQIENRGVVECVPQRCGKYFQ